MSYQKTIEDAVYTWATTNSGRTAVWENYDGNVPTGPFLSLNTIAQGGFGSDSKSVGTDASGILSIVGQRSLTIIVTAFGNSNNVDASALNCLHDLHLSLGKPSVQEYFDSKAIGVVSYSTPSVRAGFGSKTEHEVTASMTITLRTSVVYTDTTGFFNTVDGIGSIIKNEGEE